MRRLCLLISLLLLTGCEKSFDERYADVEAEVKTDAAKIDRDLKKEEAKNPSTSN